MEDVAIMEDDATISEDVAIAETSLSPKLHLVYYEIAGGRGRHGCCARKAKCSARLGQRCRRR